MTGFSSDWLHLREPFDEQARARASTAIDLVSQWLAWRAHQPASGLSIVDLACGTGSNLRWLAPRLGGAQRWRLVDHDPALLAAVPTALQRWARERGFQYRELATTAAPPGSTIVAATPSPTIEVGSSQFTAQVTLQSLDLAARLPDLDLSDTALVTASALLDLVSDRWLRALVQQAAQARVAMWFALSVDGATQWTPADAKDAAVEALFAAHQQRDKGFGLALGAAAITVAAGLMRRFGYAVSQTGSDWIIDARRVSAGEAAPGDAAAMVAAMIDGIAEAAGEQAREPVDGAVAQWRARRQALAPQTRLQVGHVDLLALPRP